MPQTASNPLYYNNSGKIVYINLQEKVNILSTEVQDLKYQVKLLKETQITKETKYEYNQRMCYEYNQCMYCGSDCNPENHPEEPLSAFIQGINWLSRHLHSIKNKHYHIFPNERTKTEDKPYIRI